MAETELSIITASNTGAGAGAGQTNELPIAIRRTTAPSNQPPHRVSLFGLVRSSIRSTYDKFCANPALAGNTVAVVSVVVGALTLWFSFAAVADTRKATLLAEWTAKKDFFEFCESHNWEIDPGCHAAKDSPPGPPPVVDPRDKTPGWPSRPRNAGYSHTVPVKSSWEKEYGDRFVTLLLGTVVVTIFVGMVIDQVTQVKHLVPIYERNMDRRHRIGHIPKDPFYPKPLHPYSPFGLRDRGRRRFFPGGLD